MKLNHIYCGDCLDIMRGMKDNSIDLCLTDPPYGIGEANGKNKSRGKLAIAKDFGCENWDDKIPDKEIFNEMFRISKNQIIFGGNYFVEYLKNSSCWIVWDKDNGASDFADCELAWTSFSTAVRKLKHKWQGMLQENMKYKEYRYHPTQKPIRLMKWIIENYSQKDNIILDPFLGSGTTAIACKELGRKYIGIEISQKYCDIAEKRLAQGIFDF